MHKETYGPEYDKYKSFFDEEIENVTVYDTVDELFSEPIGRAWMDDKNYYIQHKSDMGTGWSDTSMYVIDKETKNVLWKNYLDFMFDEKDKCVPLDVSKLKELLN